MGKKRIFILLMFMMTYLSHAQIDGTLLVGLTNATTTEMNAISNIPTGALLFNTTALWVYQYNGSSWEKLLGNNLLPSVKNNTSDYTLAPTDNGVVLTFDSSSDVTLTIVSGLPVGFNISVYQTGNGKVNFAEASGVTLKNRLSRYKTAGKDAGAGLICTAVNVCHITGDLKK